jgi:polyphenol oxidase
MNKKEAEGVTWLEFELFAECKGIKQASFLRHGGTSEGGYATLNLGLFTQDLHERVLANHQKIESLLGFPSLAFLQQLHSNHLVEAKVGSQLGDALMTDQQNLGLLITHADCQAALLYDPTHAAIAAVHCGWRGQILNIYKSTIAAMQAKYRSNPADLLVAISPSLGPTAFEFLDWREKLPPSFHAFQEKPNYFNFWEISRNQLLDSGILSHHIQVAAICTYSHPEDHFSHRRHHLGLNGTMILLT